MNRKIKLFALAICIAMLFTSCALPAHVQSEESALVQARQNYRSAALVVSGICEREHIDVEGNPCYDLSIERVLAGQAIVGDIVHCNTAMQNGERYLLYLQQGADTPYAEDMENYTLVNDEVCAIAGDRVRVGGQSVALSELLRDMAKLDAIISVPSEVYYYETLAPLVKAADDIFIGQVSYVPPLHDTQFRSQSNGATSEHTLPASIVQVTAYGGIKGALKYGDTLRLVYAPAMSADLLSAATLTAVRYGEADAPALQEGDICLFFITQSPDAKQEYCFPVNPMQGFVRVRNNELQAGAVNRALRDYAVLDDAVNAIRAALR
ncbi:MAG: hypothetical protein LBN26_03420 [Christensenellaceae bacterium]|jgi:hypothetical protein|nr:hypothetical protein [Christensenellaceae bacterium]